MKNCIKGLLLLAVCLMAASESQALVMHWNLGKGQIFEQTADNTAPATPMKFKFFSEIDVDVPGDFSIVMLDGTPGFPVYYAEQYGGQSWNIDEDFTTESELDTAYPDGDYSIDATVSVGIIREPISITGSFPTDIPFFSGAVASALQSFDSTQDFTLTWDAPSAALEAFIYIHDVALDQEVWSIDVTSNTNALIPANTLQDGREYVAGLVFLDKKEDAKSSFTTGKGETVKANATEVSFTVVAVPEPTSLALLLTLACAVRFRRVR